MPTFLLPLLLLAATCGLGCWAVLHATDQAYTWHFGLLLAWFTAITAALLHWQERRAVQINLFIRRFMAGLVMKLMGSLVLLAILLKLAPENVDGPLTAAFGALYLAFLVFSTVRLSRIMRTSTKRP